MKAFHDYSRAAAPSPVLGNIPPNDGMPGGPIPPGFFQVGTPLLPTLASAPCPWSLAFWVSALSCLWFDFFSEGMLGKQHARVADLCRNNSCSAVLHVCFLFFVALKRISFFLEEVTVYLQLMLFSKAAWFVFGLGLYSFSGPNRRA